MSKIMILLSYAVEITYFMSLIFLIVFIYKNKNRTKHGNKFWIKVMAFIISSFFANPIVGLILQEYVEKIIFRLSLYAEIIFIIWIINTVLENKYSKYIFSVLTFLLLFILPETQYQGMISLNFDFQLFYTAESIVVSTMAIFYFFELRSKLSEINLFENAYTLIMLGIFFCFFIPINYNVAYFTYVNYEKNDFIREISKDPSILNLSLVSYNITRFSLILLILFFYRAIKVDINKN